MTLKELIDSAHCGPGETPAGKGFAFPPFIELPHMLHAYMVQKWVESEQKREEIGGNLKLVGHIKLDFQAIDVVDGHGGNSVEIRPRNDLDVVANFHTHPSTPGGTNLERCGYQPPSIEDAMAMSVQHQQKRDIFVSFVVARQSDLYAMVYVRGISHFSPQDVEKTYFYNGSLYEKGKRIKFPTDKDEIDYRLDLAGSGDDRKNAMNNKLELDTNYGERFSELIWEHLYQVCFVLSLGLYRGDGFILNRQK
jgi:hypothetical protein